MGTAVSIVATAVVGLAGWALRVQIATLARALGSIPLLVYLWMVAVVIIGVWVVAQFTDRDLDLSFKILTFVIVIGALLASLPSKKQDPPAS